MTPATTIWRTILIILAAATLWTTLGTLADGQADRHTPGDGRNQRLGLILAAATAGWASIPILMTLQPLILNTLATH